MVASFRHQSIINQVQAFGGSAFMGKEGATAGEELGLKKDPFGEKLGGDSGGAERTLNVPARHQRRS